MVRDARKVRAPHHEGKPLGRVRKPSS
jgi:hypothetical protein